MHRLAVSPCPVVPFFLVPTRAGFCLKLLEPLLFVLALPTIRSTFAVSVLVELAFVLVLADFHAWSHAIAVAFLPWPLHADELIGAIRPVNVAFHVLEVNQSLHVDQDFPHFERDTSIKDAIVYLNLHCSFHLICPPTVKNLIQRTD